MAGPTVLGELREDRLLAGYVFFGEETCLAEEFVDELAKTLAGPAGAEFHLARFELGEARWAEIIDTARTAPFLFEPWRALVVRFPERKANAERGWGKGGEADKEGAKGPKFLAAHDQAILRDYFAAPPSRTVIVVIIPGRLKKSDAAVRFFSSLPKSAVAVAEIKTLGPGALMRRAAEKARTLGKTLTDGANARLCEIVGSDLRLLMNEVEKLAVFVGERKGIETDDVDQATAWQRSFESYELDDALMAADLDKGAAVLNVLLSEGERPEQIVARLAGHLRTVLSAQTRLRERGKTREDIFRETYPYIQKTYGFYKDKYDAFFGAVDGLPPPLLNGLLGRLQRADRLLKTTDVEPQPLFEAFLWEYCAARKRKSLISEERS
ncbi:MAG: DNA polymerase III subunit delta [Candidatus Aminicenantes bacterium]|nr:DNA polymerase III subunit delta [Candidatus Aminicenantes bacterium]